MSQATPKLLVSVREASEALDAMAGGADWIDLKEPLKGPLGIVSAKVALEIVTTVRNHNYLSAALGELIDWESSHAHELLNFPEIAVVKIGLASCSNLDWQRQWVEVFSQAQIASKKLAAVIYADWEAAEAPFPEEVIDCIGRVGGEYLLIDTWCKSGPSTLELLGVKKLSNILLMAQNIGLTTVVAGKIRLEDISVISSLPVHIIAVRGAVCSLGREDRLKLELVREFRRQLGSDASKSRSAISI